jgi:hypothetical protein
MEERVVPFWNKRGIYWKGEFGRSSQLQPSPLNLSATLAIHLGIKSK